MANNDPPKTPTTSTAENSSSSSSSDGSSSTPNTPPSPTVPLAAPQPALVQETSQNGRYSAAGVKKVPKSSPNKSRLGAIDEDSDAVSPDIPLRNPLRRLGIKPMKFSLTPVPTLHAKRPKNIYDDIEGPRGEKFSDLRNNHKSAPGRRWNRTCSWKMLACIGCLILVIVVALVVGLVVGLRARNNTQQSTPNVSQNPQTPGVVASVPTGNYSIANYLTNINASCTTNAATWRCYPDLTYSRSVSASLSTLNWVIAPNDAGYVISSTDQVFSYIFQNVPLTKMSNGTEDEHWTFTTVFDKLVIPTAQITDDGASARCFYNSTTLTGRLFTKKPKAQALQSASSAIGGSNNIYQPWPYALDFYEAHNSGAGVPNCYKYIDGALGSRVTVGSVQDGARCSCTYTNFF